MKLQEKELDDDNTSIFKLRNGLRSSVWIENLQQDAKGLVIFSILLMIFRILFIWIFKEQLASNIGVNDYIETLWLGFRLSLKTVGVVVLTGFVLGTLIQLCIPRWPASAIRRYIYSIYTMIFTILFFCRIPYYSIFNATFNTMLINGIHDDIWATIQTAILEYGLLYRLPASIVLGLGLCWIVNWCMKTKTVSIYVSSKKQEALIWGLSIVLIPTLWVLLRFGGAFTYAHSVNFENVARTPSNLLNEAILDDGQALKRVQLAYKKFKAQKNISFTSAQLREKINQVGGNPNVNTIDEAFMHTIHEERMVVQPNTVVLLLGESYGLWPFLHELDNIGSYVSSEGRSLANMGIATENMLAHRDGTILAVNGYVTGLPDVGLYTNYEGMSYKEPYGMGLGHIMKQLGYKTVFWYGGFGTWQDLERFVLAQGFDEFHGANDFSYEKGNAWGAVDGEFYKAVESYMESHKGEKIFYLVLSTSNHPPYDVQVNEAGIDWGRIKGVENELIKKDDQSYTELAHYWYADHTMGAFVRNVQKVDGNSLFFITGDHSERFSFAKEVDWRMRAAIPFIVYGKGVKKDWFKAHTFGSSTQIPATIAEIVGRKGQRYSSMEPSLFGTYNFAFNHRYYVDKTGFYEQNTTMPKAYREYIENLRDITLWRVVKGNAI